MYGFSGLLWPLTHIYRRGDRSEMDWVIKLLKISVYLSSLVEICVLSANNQFPLGYCGALDQESYAVVQEESNSCLCSAHVYSCETASQCRWRETILCTLQANVDQICWAEAWQQISYLNLQISVPVRITLSETNSLLSYDSWWDYQIWGQKEGRIVLCFENLAWKMSHTQYVLHILGAQESNKGSDVTIKSQWANVKSVH